MSRLKTLSRILIYVTLSVISLLATSIGVRAVLDHYQIGANYPLLKKIIHVRNAEKKFDVIFAGSSYMYRSIRPKVFSKYLKSYGYDFNAYSLTEAGSYGFEIDHYLNLLTDLPINKRPDYVFINLFPVTRDYIITVKEENNLSNRMIRYHDLATTYRNIQALLLIHWDFGRKYKAILNHVTHWFYNIGNIGMGWILDEQYHLSPKEKTWIVEGYGYMPALTGEQAQKSGFTLEAYSESLENHKRRIQQSEASSSKHKVDVAEAVFRAQQYKKLQNHGMQVIYVIPPAPYGLGNMHALCEIEGFPVCFRMDDPYKYPELFEFENRYDMGHLNDKGAEYFSEYFAQKFIEYLETTQ